jgi:hypothetical protein
MGRRFALGSQVAFVATIVGGIWGWFELQNIEPIERPVWALVIGVPSLAGVAMIALCVAWPALSGDGTLRRPLTFTLPAVHTAMTALFAKALLTGPSAAVAVPAPLRAAVIWLDPVPLAMLFGGTVLVLEVLARLPKPSLAQ